MRGIITVRSLLGAAPELPAVGRTRSGVEFDTGAERWAYRDTSSTVSLNFLLLQSAGDELIISIKAVLLWYAENMSPSHLKNMFSHIEHFLRFLGVSRLEPITEITSEFILNYRGSLQKKDGWYLGSLSGLLQKWHELGYPGVSDDAISLLKQLRIDGNLKGEAVLTMDPNHGPFTDIEVQSIQEALNAAFSDGRVNLENYLLVYLYMLLGQRTVQYAALKVKDVDVSRSKDGVLVYMLRVPRAKQREQLSRAEFKNRVILPKIGELLVKYVDQVRTQYTDKLPDPADAPIFPAKQSRANEPIGFKYHRTSGSLAYSIY